MVSKIKVVEIENFQSHEKTVIPLAGGLNIFVGASDQGKSAIVRALRWVLFNEPRGSEFIRAGASICRVKVVLNDGTEIIRQRSAGTNRYILRKDGEEKVFEGFGNTVPAEIIRAHGIRKINLDGENDMVLNLGTQLEPPFLLDASGALKAKALGRINGVHILDAAQRDTVRDIMRLQSREQELRERKKSLQESLKEYADLPQMEKTLEEAVAKLKGIREMRDKCRKLRRLKERYTELEEGLTSVNTILQMTRKLEDAAETLDKADTELQRYKRLIRYRKRKEEIDTSLKKAESILRETAGIEQGNEFLERAVESFIIKNKLAKWKDKLEAVFKSLTGTELVLQRTAQIKKAQWKLEALERAAARYTALKAKDLTLKKIDAELEKVKPVLQAAPAIKESEEIITELESASQRLSQLKKNYGKIRAVEKRLEKAKEFYNQHEKEYRKLLQQYRDTLQRLGRCPVCYSPLDESQLDDIIANLKI